MPMTTVAIEENLDELLGRLNPDLSPPEFKRIRDVTLELNPHLRLQENFQPGTTIVLPDLNQSDVVALAPQRDVGPTGGIDLLMIQIKDYLPVLKKELESKGKKLAELSDSIPLVLEVVAEAMESPLAEKAKSFAEKTQNSLKVEREENQKALGNLDRGAERVLADLSVLLKSLS